LGDVLAGDKDFKTGFKGALKGLPSAVGVPASTYGRRGRYGEPVDPAGVRFDLSDIAEPAP
jgi:hypothetical protein